MHVIVNINIFITRKHFTIRFDVLFILGNRILCLLKVVLESASFLSFQVIKENLIERWKT